MADEVETLTRLVDTTNALLKDANRRAELAAQLAEALDMLLRVATDERSKLPRLELYTDMALNGARTALDKARTAGLLHLSSITSELVNK